MGKGGEYFVAKKDEEGTQLVPSSKKVFAREVIPYGFDFKFGGHFLDNKNFGICAYGHEMYRKPKRTGNLPKTNEEYGRINLNLTIKGLEKELEEKGADYILIDNFFSKHEHSSWNVRGRAQTLIKR